MLDGPGYSGFGIRHVAANRDLPLDQLWWNLTKFNNRCQLMSQDTNSWSQDDNSSALSVRYYGKLNRTTSLSSGSAFTR